MEKKILELEQKLQSQATEQVERRSRDVGSIEQTVATNQAFQAPEELSGIIIHILSNKLIREFFTISRSVPFFLTWHKSQSPIILTPMLVRIPNRLRFNLKP